MLHYLSTGPRDYHARQIGVSVRSGWELQAVLSGRMAPLYPETSDHHDTFFSKHLWIFAPGVPHGWLSPLNEPCQIVVLHVDTEDMPVQLARACEDSGVLDRSLNLPDVRQIGQLVADLRQHYPRLTNLTSMYTQRLLIELAIIALRDQSLPVSGWTQRYNEQRVRVAMTWFGQNISQHVGVSEMAQAAGVSPAHLRRLFAETGQQSPLHAINVMRTERARHLLRDTELSIAEIADAIGMSGPTVFCRWFKQQMNHTPIVWRDLVRAGKA